MREKNVTQSDERPDQTPDEGENTDKDVQFGPGTAKPGIPVTK